MKKRNADGLLLSSYKKISKRFTLVKKTKLTSLKLLIITAFVLGGIITIGLGYKRSFYSSSDASTFPNHQCATDGKSAVITLSQDPNAKFAFRYDKGSGTWNGNCQSPNEGDQCNDNGGSSFTVTTTPGEKNTYWAHPWGENGPIWDEASLIKPLEFKCEEETSAPNETGQAPTSNVSPVSSNVLYAESKIIQDDRYKQNLPANTTATLSGDGTVKYTTNGQWIFPPGHSDQDTFPRFEYEDNASRTYSKSSKIRYVIHFLSEDIDGHGKTFFYPGEKLKIKVLAVVSHLPQQEKEYVDNINFWASINGKSYAFFNNEPVTINPKLFCLDHCRNWPEKEFELEIPAGTPGGEYTVNFGPSQDMGTLDKIMFAYPIGVRQDAECGSADNEPVKSDTYSNQSLCKTGTPLSTTGTDESHDPYKINWSCLGLFGGKNAVCSASRLNNDCNLAISSLGDKVQISWSVAPSIKLNEEKDGERSDLVISCKTGSKQFYVGEVTNSGTATKPYSELKQYMDNNLSCSASVKYFVPNEYGSRKSTCNASAQIGIGLNRTDGACGQANGTALSQAPSGSQLCLSGDPGQIERSESGSWKWICQGTNGGAKVDCVSRLANPCKDNPNSELCGKQNKCQDGLYSKCTSFDYASNNCREWGTAARCKGSGGCANGTSCAAPVIKSFSGPSLVALSSNDELNEIPFKISVENAVDCEIYQKMPNYPDFEPTFTGVSILPAYDQALRNKDTGNGAEVTRYVKAPINFGISDAEVTYKLVCQNSDGIAEAEKTTTVRIQDGTGKGLMDGKFGRFPGAYFCGAAAYADFDDFRTKGKVPGNLCIQGAVASDVNEAKHSRHPNDPPTYTYNWSCRDPLPTGIPDITYCFANQNYSSLSTTTNYNDIKNNPTQAEDSSSQNQTNDSSSQNNSNGTPGSGKPANPFISDATGNNNQNTTTNTTANTSNNAPANTTTKTKTILCGSDNGKLVDSKPTSLCQNGGQASSVSQGLFSDAWKWDCSLGERTVKCVAYQRISTTGGSWFASESQKVDGQCGSDNGKTLSEKPAEENRCSAGRPSGITFSEGTWRWACFGYKGKNNATCSANR